MLKITRSADPITVERLNLCLYAPPGIGKTSVAFSAAAPLLLDFDGGAHRAANRKDIVRVTQWDDVAGITADDLAPYSTVIVDTAGRALDILSADIIRKDPKKGYGGALNLQGYGVLKAQFIAFLKLLNGFGKDVVLIAHMDEQRNGDDVFERLDVQGGSKNEIYKAADAMGRISIKNGQRMLNFSPTDASFGKNPGHLDPLQVPHPDKPEFATFLAGVIQSIKTRLNQLTEEQRAQQEVIERWRTSLNDIEDAAGINALIPSAKEAGPAVSMLLNARALKLALHFDKAAGAYVADEQQAA